MSRLRTAEYIRVAEITARVVRDWIGEVPRFALPPREIALIADLRDIGARLVRNDGARQLLALLIRRCVERTGDAPTVIMLDTALDYVGIAVERVSLSDLGLADRA
jgi:hypothetical protein